MADTQGMMAADGTPVVEDCAHMNAFRELIAPGMHVHTDTGEDAGKIKRYDPFTGGMLVEKGGFSRHDLYIPITVVQRVDVKARAVYLTVSKAHLQRIDGSEPAAVLFIEASDIDAR
ncbi:MAG TPA: hypothetical protein VHB98_16565 [Chloroflexota bacterium]|nr:hypothetical protein [Chloroflexota bacterium]